MNKEPSKDSREALFQSPQSVLTPQEQEKIRNILAECEYVKNLPNMQEQCVLHKERKAKYAFK